jgi:hypothetical protein
MAEPDEPQQEASDDRSAELDGLKIRQLATLRRAAYRSRSHAVIAMVVCVVAVGQAGVLLVQHLRQIGVGPRVPVYIAFIVAGAYGAIYFMRRALALHREATQTRVENPTSPPDFSTLSDGSQRWKNLEELR